MSGIKENLPSINRCCRNLMHTLVMYLRNEIVSSFLFADGVLPKSLDSETQLMMVTLTHTQRDTLLNVTVAYLGERNDPKPRPRPQMLNTLDQPMPGTNIFSGPS